MSRPALGLAGALAAALLAAACGAPQGGSGEGDPGPVRFTLFGDPTETAGYQRLVDAFERDNPGVEVEMTPVAKQDDLLAKLVTGFAGGRSPDVFLVNHRKYGQFAGQGVLEPVQARLDASDAIAERDFADTALEAFRYDGEELTCLPQNVSSLVVYYNADLFRRAGLPAPRRGWTWADFLAAAKVLTGGGTYGVGVEPSLIRVAPFVWSAGGEVVDDLTRPTTLALASPEARRGLDFFLDLRSRHGVTPPERDELSQGSEERFLSGRLGMYLDSRKAVPTMRDAADFAWDVAPVPVAPGGRPATILHGDAYCMAKGSPRADAAWRLVEYANTAAGQRILAESGRTVPSRPDVARSPAFLRPGTPPASSRVFVEAIPTIRAVPHTAAWSRVEEGLRELVEATRPLFGQGGA